MKPWFTVVAAVVAVGVGVWTWQQRQAPATGTVTGTGTEGPAATAPPAANEPVTGAAAETPLQTLPSLSYPDLEGNLHSTDEWRDKVLVLNFWATWCPPCRKETPLFVKLQGEYQARGVQFVGIAIDEPQAVQDFADTYGVDYPILIGDMGAVQASRELGNRFSGLPFTVIVAPGGQIVVRHFGGMEREQLAPVLDRLTEGADGG